MNEQQIAELIRKYNEGTLGQEEQLALDMWYLKFANESTSILDEEKEVDMVARLKSALPLVQKPLKVKLWSMFAFAAAMVAALASVALWFLSSTTPSPDKFYANDKVPGGNGATLTLANGKKIYISASDTGEIAHESGVRITKSADGKIIYELEDNMKGAEGFNTLETSNGQQAQIHLPDGSIVQLNAASSLRYPFSFLGHDKRSVELLGEGFFEVSKDSQHPFVVTTGSQQVEVLGTEFNINAYSSDALVKTTLLAGSVKINDHITSKILVPGQQASAGNGGIDVEDVEVEYVVAWKKGYFLFKDESLQQIMQKLARWYNIEPVYADQTLKNRTFFGSISKFENISKILFIMEQTNVASFEIKGNQVIISKK